LERLAQDNQWDSLLSENWRAAANNVFSILQSGWVQYPAAFFVGCAFSLWIDGILRRREATTLLTPENKMDVRTVLQQVYAANSMLDKYEGVFEFLTEARDIRICLDYQGKMQGQKDWGGWTRVTLLTKDYVAKGEYLYKNIFTIEVENNKRVMVIDSPNDLSGRKRTRPNGYFMQCVVIVFYAVDGEQRETRTPFVVSNPFIPLRAWPEIDTEIKLNFRGMD